MATYVEQVLCPGGHTFRARRRIEAAGSTVSTYCPTCKRYYGMTAGPVPLRAIPSGPRRPPVRESQVEQYLKKRVEALGGEVRKVQWIGRNGAPDRLVMLPGRDDLGIVSGLLWPPRTIWVELKAPGKGATFPSNAHERAQHREHERMRKMGQVVVVIDSYEQVEELLK